MVCDCEFHYSYLHVCLLFACCAWSKSVVEEVFDSWTDCAVFHGVFLCEYLSVFGDHKRRRLRKDGEAVCGLVYACGEHQFYCALRSVLCAELPSKTQGGRECERQERRGQEGTVKTINLCIYLFLSSIFVFHWGILIIQFLALVQL